MCVSQESQKKQIKRFCLFLTICFNLSHLTGCICVQNKYTYSNNCIFYHFRYQKEQKTKRLNDIKENELIKQKIDENRKKTTETTPVIEAPQPLGLPGRFVKYHMIREGPCEKEKAGWILTNKNQQKQMEQVFFYHRQHCKSIKTIIILRKVENRCVGKLNFYEKTLK